LEAIATLNKKGRGQEAKGILPSVFCLLQSSTFEVHNWKLGVWNSEFGVWSLKLGIWSLELETSLSSLPRSPTLVIVDR
jgi:hypothetical protein